MYFGTLSTLWPFLFFVLFNMCFGNVTILWLVFCVFFELGYENVCDLLPAKARDRPTA